MDRSPAAERTTAGPVLASTNDPVPYVHLVSPGLKQAWPNSAACWSPAMPATGRSRPRNAPGSVRATTPVEGTTSGSARCGTCSSSHSSPDHRPAPISNSRVREAFDASVTCRAPAVIRAIR